MVRLGDVLRDGANSEAPPAPRRARPGLVTPTEIGEYEIACAELCGLGHYKMHGMLKVVSQEDFDKWLAAREAEK